MSSAESETTPDAPSSPVARKQPNSNVFPVTLSPTKYCGSKQKFIGDKPSIDAWKSSSIIPPTIVNDDPFIDDRNPSSISVPIGDKLSNSTMLIPVTTKMLKSAVSICNKFVLKDGHLLHLVKVVGAVWFYHEYMNNVTMDLEDGIGQIWVVILCPYKECSLALALHPKCNDNGYVRVIGTVKDEFGIREIIELDVRPVSSGNEITYHLFEVAYSFDKFMEKKMDEESKAIDLDQIIREEKLAIDTNQEATAAIAFDEDDDLNAVDLNTFTSKHMEDIANENM